MTEPSEVATLSSTILGRARSLRATAQRIADNDNVAAGGSYGDLLQAAGVDALIEIGERLGELVDLVREAWDQERTPASPTVERICRYCGCTDEQACPGGCSWVTDDLCSACQQRAQDAGSDPLGERGYVQ